MFGRGLAAAVLRARVRAEGARGVTSKPTYRVRGRAVYRSRDRRGETGVSTMLRILHLADLHLGWKPHFLGSLIDERQRERDELLRRAVDFALQETVNLVIIAGDLFETHKPPSALVEAVIAQLQRLVSAGVAVVTVPGNHDEITYADSVYRIHAERWPGVLIQNPMPDYVTTLDVNGTSVHVYGLAYTGGLTRPPIEQFPRLEKNGVHIAVFHGSLDWDAGDRSLPLTSRALAAAGYDYVALGHIHRPSEHKIGSGLAVYPGMVEGKGFSDPGVGEFTVASIDTDESGGRRATRVAIEKFAADVRRVRSLELDVTPLEDMDAVAAHIRAEAGDGRDIVQVRLVGAAPGFIDTEALQARLAAHFYFLEVSDDTSMLDDAVVERLALEPTVRGEFVRRMRARIADAADDAQRELAARALRRGLAALGGSST